jgi:anthranilate phosphoribosyltransferase
VSAELSPLLETLSSGGALEQGDLERAFAIVMDGQASAPQVTAFLQASIPLMTDPAALAAGARALRSRMIAVAAPAGAIDVCGTGGDGAHTLNISTAVAFVLAGGDVPVAKHGNRAMSSRAGAADVLEALGVALTADPATLERCLAETNIAFLFAQNHHPAMRHVAAARRAFGRRTIFNLLGPLSNPAGVTRQLVGVFGPAYIQPLAHALSALGGERAWVVHGAGGLDELSCCFSGANDIAALEAGAVDVRRQVFATASDPHDADQLRGGDAADNADALRRLLDGSSRNIAYLDAVELNAAAAFVVAGRAETIEDGLTLARDSLASGIPLRTLNALIEITQDAP